MANEFVARNGIIAKDNSTITGTLAVSGNITMGGVIVATRTWVTGAALTGYATESYVTTAINNLIDSAPGALNTLNELAAALGDDPNFATTVTNSIGTKVSKAGDTMTGNINWGTSDRGLTWSMNTDGAYIKFFNTGDGDTNSRLEYGTSDNGNEFHRWMVSTAEEMTLKSDGLRVTDSIWMGGNLVATQSWVNSQNYLTTVPDEYLTETEGDALYAPISHTHAATDITSGTLAAARLSGNYAINVTGSAATLTTARTLTIGNTGKTFNGSANVAWTLSEIGAIPSRSGIIKSGGIVDTTSLFPFSITTAQTAIGFEYNILLNAQKKGYTVTQSGTGQVGAPFNLFDGRLEPNYSGDGVNPADPFVLLIEGLPNVHSQTGGVFGWTCRYWVPTIYKVEAFDSYNNVGWKTLVDQQSPLGTKDLVIPIYQSGFSGALTKFRITIYDSNGSTGANGFRRWGISEIFFIHPEAQTTHQFLDVEWAKKLSTARTIGGVSFDGSANINLPGVNTTGNQNTTGSAATLTTARTLTIGNTGKTFNGSANVSWSLAEIGAQAALTNPVTGTGTTNYLPKLTGASTIGNSQVFDNGTNVGIGTTAPDSLLHVAKQGNANGGSIIMGLTGNATSKWSMLAGAHYNQDTGTGNGSGSAGVAIIGALSTDTFNRVYVGGGPYEVNPSTEITFWTHGATTHNLGGSQRMVINSTGYVGIGTTSPTQKLEVSGSIQLTNKADSILFGPSGGDGTWGAPKITRIGTQIIISDFSGVQLGGYDGSSYGPRLTVLGTGNVGIGTTSPATKLDVNGVITATGGNSTNWNTAYGWGNHASAGYLTSYTETDTLASVTGRGATTSTTLTLARVVTTGLYGPGTNGNIPIWQFNAGNPGYGIVYVEGSPDLLRIDVSGQALTGTPDFLIGPNYAQVNGNNVWHAGNDGAGSGLDADLLDGEQGSYYLDWTNITNKPDPVITLAGAVTGAATMTDLGNITITTTATSDPVITLTGAVTGSGTMTNLGNVSITTTATSDPVLTLAGDATGSATFTNLGNATLTVTVVDDSHIHDGRYYTETESDARFVNVTGDTVTGDLTVSGAALGVISTTAGSDAFYVDGVNGRLFTVTDSLDDSLFSVNTVAGLPVIEAFADNTVNLGPFTNPVTISSTGTLSIGGLQAATQSYVDTAITNLIGGAPGALDTLNELAAAINDDASYASTITSALALKAPLASPALTGTPTAPTAATATNTTQIATTAFVKAQGYITGYTETDTLATVTGRGATTSNTIQVGKLGIGRAAASNESISVENPEGRWLIQGFRSGVAIGGLHTNGGILYVQADNVRIQASSSATWNGDTLATRPWVTAQGYTTNTGTVTSVSGTGSYGGLTLSGTVTSSGNITLGGTPTGTWPISVSGNAATATSATTATSAATWTTARNLTIGNTAKSVNGSANVAWTLAEIGAAAVSHNHTSLTGVTSIGFAAEASDVASISTTISGTSTFFDFNLTDDNNNDEWRWRFTPSGATVYNAMRLIPVTNTTANLVVSGTIAASNFSGTSSGTNTGDQTTISGNAGSATVLANARTFTIGATSRSFNGSANVSWTLAEIGAQAAGSYAAASHTHDDRYYTETESDAKYWKGIAGSVSATTSNPFDSALTETRVTGNGNYVINYTGASAQLISSATGGSASIFHIGAHYNGSDFYMRTRTDSTTWQTWKRLWHSSDFTSTNVSNWNTAFNWGNHAGLYLGISDTAADSNKLGGLAAASYYLASNPSGYITSSSNITGTSAGVVSTVSGTNSAELVRGNMGDNDQARILVGATASNAGYLEIATADDGTEPIHVRQYTGVFTTLARTATILDASGNTILPGNLTVGGTITENSSIRYKENIVDLEFATEKVEQLRPVRYNKIETEQEEIGLIAEEVAEIYPEVVTYNEEGQPDGVNYTRLSVILLKSVQELAERINKLENK